MTKTCPDIPPLNSLDDKLSISRFKLPHTSVRISPVKLLELRLSIFRLGILKSPGGILPSKLFFR